MLRLLAVLNCPVEFVAVKQQTATTGPRPVLGVEVPFPGLQQFAQGRPARGQDWEEDQGQARRKLHLHDGETRKDSGS